MDIKRRQSQSPIQHQHLLALESPVHCFLRPDLEQPCSATKNVIKKSHKFMLSFQGPLACRLHRTSGIVTVTFHENELLISLVDCIILYDVT